MSRFKIFKNNTGKLLLRNFKLTILFFTNIINQQKMLYLRPKTCRNFLLWQFYFKEITNWNGINLQRCC